MGVICWLLVHFHDSGRKKTAFLTFNDPEALEFALLLSAVLRDLYAYFADRPLKEIPHIDS
ncbi:putative 6-phosphofructo-2-kinase, Fructose-2,6-bisphosphate 2-phosphatase [Helianthus annuus]|nr:putative 6-phosphofructo-2-kinase, Fructose-2,6-bisphosphate 2-phosphatase [Helianthus annuus]